MAGEGQGDDPRPSPAEPGPSAPAAQLSPELEFAAFHASLREVTPRVRVAPTLVAINVAVFVAMVATGVSFIAPTADSALGWGANFGPRTLGGQPWRLLTNAFVHFGIIHLALNMLALWNAGAVVERIFGPVSFAALYLAAGLTGSVASLTVHPQVVSAGASGAVFGVYGALAVFLVRQRGVIPMAVLTRLRGVALSFIAYNILFGFTSKAIDNAAHIGGLLGGAAAGALLARPLVPGRASAWLRSLMVVGGAVALAALAILTLPKPVDYEKTVGDFFAMEGPTLDRYNALIRDAQAGKLDDAALAAMLEQEILPRWREAHQRLATPRPWRDKQKEIIGILLRYADVRERGFTHFARALRTDDEEAARLAQAHQTEAAAALEELKAVKLD